MQTPPEMPPLDPEAWRKADELLGAALHLPTGERRHFVENQIDDAAIVAAVLSLMDLEGQVPPFLDQDAIQHALPFLADVDEPPVPGSLAAGDRVGAYRLVEEIGRGGMGVVFLAERDDGRFQKRVAIKVLPHQPHPSAGNMGGRFHGERQILAQLDHPAIARLLDGGETDQGEPYLVMEYVEGERIDAYCDRRRLSVGQRIDLFLTVGEAVAYAHQNLVVHRDIKPSNVLVSAAGEVKLLDFGIAKVLSGAPAAATLLTQKWAMTPAYASPEQLRGEPIRTVSDVYSLGVLLYELLTGCRPFRSTGQPHEVARAILEQEPPRPSVAVASAPASDIRGANPERLLRGDLDAIVLTALRKQPERRYSSVEGMLDDLRRHRAGAPVTARTGDRWYRLLKVARRSWAALTVATAVVTLTAGFAAFHARRIQGERDVARRQAATAQAVTQFVTSLFDASNAWEVPQARADSVTARALLEQGARRIRTELADQVEVRAELLSTLGSIHSSLGLLPQAESLLEEALVLRRGLVRAGDDVVAGDLDRLGLHFYRKKDYGRAEALNRQAYDLRRRRYGPDSEQAAISLGRIAMALRKKGQLAESEQLFRASLEGLRKIHGDRHPEVAAAIKGLAMVRRQRGDLDEAERLGREGLALSERLLGAGNPRTAEHMSDLATILRTKGDLDSAERLLRRVLEQNRKWFGNEHPNLALRWNSLGLILHQKADAAGAEKAYREALRINRKFIGPTNAAVAENLHNLARVLRDQKDLPAAKAMLEEALAMRRKVLAANHADIGVTAAALGEVALDENDLLKAAALFREALALFREQAPDHLGAPGVYVGLGRTLIRLGRPGAAEPLLEEGCRLLERTFPARHPRVLACRAALAGCLGALGRQPTSSQEGPSR